MEHLSTIPLRNALERLRVNLTNAAENHDRALFPTLRDGCIQAFEYSYDSAIKLLKRVLEQHFGAANVDQIPYRDMLRLAVETGLIATIDPWILFRAYRNDTSHTYDEAKARRVYDGLQEFCEQGRHFLTIVEDILHAPRS